MANIPQVNDSNFDVEVLTQDRPVLVDFWADWCGPCKIIEPHLVAISEELSSKLRVVGLDIDANPRTAGRFGVMSIPTVILFNGGEEVVRLIGAQPKPKILAQIEPFLADAGKAPEQAAG